MNKICGNLSDYVPVREDRSRYVISYGLEEAPNNLYTWYEIYIYKKQKSYLSFQDVKDAILDDINSKVKAKILNGLEYTIQHGSQDGTHVNLWLSDANQKDYSDLDSSHDDLTFPVRYKVGENDGEEVFEFFQRKDEIHAFCCMITRFIHQCQEEGWDYKGSFDWTPYEEALNPVTD